MYLEPWQFQHANVEIIQQLRDDYVVQQWINKVDIKGEDVYCGDIIQAEKGLFFQILFDEESSSFCKALVGLGQGVVDGIGITQEYLNIEKAKIVGHIYGKRTEAS